jgi:hypothetical protein
MTPQQQHLVTCILVPGSVFLWFRALGSPRSLSFSLVVIVVLDSPIFLRLLVYYNYIRIWDRYRTFASTLQLFSLRLASDFESGIFSSSFLICLLLRIGMRSWLRGFVENGTTIWYPNILF